ncbi:MAG: GH92 family glycosyl hydrolase [Marinilabiliales bacterium]|nr:GH92 family glycosyl hydrolase [Marinilabiliales bacterium]
MNYFHLRKSTPLAMLLLFAGMFSVVAQKNDFTTKVNLFIGTYRDGQTFPGPCYPFGGVQLSPDTRKEGLSSCGGYYYPDPMILGFSHTHLSGVGDPEYRDLLFMPTVGKIRLQSGKEGIKGTGYQSSFDHKDEVARPGYYAVFLKDYGIRAELTATPRCGVHRYTFPQSDSARVILDLAHPNGAEELFLTRISNTEVEGLRRSHGWAWDQYVYFVARFSKPFKSFEIAKNDTLLGAAVTATGKNIKGVASFDTRAGEKILVKVGISAVSCEGARKNLDAEVAGWDFDALETATNKAWNKELGRIEVSGGRKDDLIQFYTSMYRLCISPNLFMDVDGQYRGHDHRVHKADGFTNYTVFSLWDTFRAFHPLMTILDTKRTTDFVRTLLQIYDDGGRLPMWPLAGNYTDDMLGYHAGPVSADAYLKGIRGYDTLKAYEAMKHSAELDKLGLKYYKQMGYLPCDRQGESVSKTLEYCYDDWCISQVSKAMGKDEDYVRYHQRAHSYENVYDPTTGFVRGKTFRHAWLAPFDPKVNSAYSEGNAYQYLFIPHDVDGLKKLAGGERKLAVWLDTLFFMPSKDTLKLGEYWHGNEPGHHLPYLFDYVGEPWKTQFLTRKILTRIYRNKIDGLAGNEDCGQMSAWYIFSALGFYPVSPGQQIYAMGSPLFEKAIVHLENGKNIVLLAPGNKAENCYVQSVTMNGKDYPNTYLRHADLMKGCQITCRMGPSPNKERGTKGGNIPWSENGEAVTQLPFVQSGEVLFTQDTRITLACETPGSNIRYTLDGAEPNDQSPLYKEPLVLNKTTLLKMKSFCPGRMASIPVEQTIRKAELNDAVLISDVLPGLEYDYFERFFVQATDLDMVRPISKGITPDFNYRMAKVPNYFGVRFNGFIRIPSDGLYTFYLASNDGSYLYLDGKELIENDANHGTVEEPGEVALKAGYHAICVKYMQCGGGKSLKVSWQGPGFSRREIEPEVLFRMR